FSRLMHGKNMVFPNTYSHLFVIYHSFSTVIALPEQPAFQYTSAPNGISASFASLKCCSPNGIPIIVTQRTSPNKMCSSDIGSPVTKSHTIFKSRDPAPPP